MLPISNISRQKKIFPHTMRAPRENGVPHSPAYISGRGWGGETPLFGCELNNLMIKIVLQGGEGFFIQVDINVGKIYFLRLFLENYMITRYMNMVIIKLY